MITRIQELMAHETAGDPMTGLKWTRRTTAKVAEELQALGIRVCDRTVARLLKQMNYSLRVNTDLSINSHASHPRTVMCSSLVLHNCANVVLPKVCR